MYADHDGKSSKKEKFSCRRPETSDFQKARVSSSMLRNVRVVVSKDIKEHSCNPQASSGSDNIIKSSRTCRI